MDNVIDFAVERAYRKSGIKDRSLLKDMIKEGYNPCNSDDVDQYHRWCGFLNVVQDVELPANHGWTDEALGRLWRDIQTLDTEQVYNVSYNFDTEDLFEVELEDGEEFIYEPDLSAFFDDEK